MQELLTNSTGTLASEMNFNIPYITTVSYVLTPTIRGNTH